MPPGFCPLRLSSLLNQTQHLLLCQAGSKLNLLVVFA